MGPKKPACDILVGFHGIFLQGSEKLEPYIGRGTNLGCPVYLRSIARARSCWNERVAFTFSVAAIFKTSLAAAGAGSEIWRAVDPDDCRTWDAMRGNLEGGPEARGVDERARHSAAACLVTPPRAEDDEQARAHVASAQRRCGVPLA